MDLYMKEMWEILVPASKGKDKFSYNFHKEWDEKVTKISGGLTVMKAAKGEWISPSGKLHKDRMIPIRISCTRKDINKIIDITLEHYDQEAVLAYRIATEVILRHRNERTV